MFLKMWDLRSNNLNTNYLYENKKKLYHPNFVRFNRKSVCAAGQSNSSKTRLFSNSIRKRVFLKSVCCRTASGSFSGAIRRKVFPPIFLRDFLFCLEKRYTFAAVLIYNSMALTRIKVGRINGKRLSLNGEWKFFWSDTPEGIPADFFEEITI